METVSKSPVMLYTEQTPNPESLKFVTNRMLYRGTADFREPEMADEWSPIGVALFELPYVKGVYICNNFITVTKEFSYNWDDIMLLLKDFIKNYIDEDGVIIRPGFEEEKARLEAESGVEYQYTGDEAELVKRIKDLIDGVYNIETEKQNLKSKKVQARYDSMNEIQLAKEIKLQEKQMLKAAKNMEFEKAAEYRDELKKLKDLLFVGLIDTKLEKVSRASASGK